MICPDREYIEEKKFVKAAYDMGCKAIKFVDPGSRNAPDRMVLCPNGRVIFFEFKRPGERSRPGQVKYQRGLEGMYFEVHEVDNHLDAINKLKNFICDL